jgi:hypothetical protein
MAAFLGILASKLRSCVGIVNKKTIAEIKFNG